MVDDIGDDDDIPACVCCGCRGNMECGRPEPPDKEMLCALLPNGICPCCWLGLNGKNPCAGCEAAKL